LFLPREFTSDRLKFKVESGFLDIRGDYDLDASGSKPQFKLRNGAVSVSDLVLSDPNDSLPPLTVPQGKVSGIEFNYPAEGALGRHLDPPPNGECDTEVIPGSALESTTLVW
jgi:hypothetical protein